MPDKRLMWLIWKIDSATLTNKLIYWLQKIPLLGKKIPNHLYGLDYLKWVNLTIGIFSKMTYIFFKRVISVIFLFLGAKSLNFLLGEFTGYQIPSNFQMSLVLLIVISFFLGTSIDIVLISRYDKTVFQFIRQFHVSPVEYFKTSQVMLVMKELMLHSLILGCYFTLNGFALWHAITFTLLVSGMRLILKTSLLGYYEKKLKHKKKGFESLIPYALVLGVGLSLIVIVLGVQLSPKLFFSTYAGLAGAIMWGYGYYRLATYPTLNQLTRQLISQDSMEEAIAAVDNIEESAVMIDQEDIDVQRKTPISVENLAGISYLHALFMQRMGKELQKGIKRRLLIVAVVFGVEVIALAFFRNQTISLFPKNLAGLLYISFILGYAIYAGEGYIKFCFYHLDRLLLKYNDYRRRDIILATLKTRFWSLIKHNIPIFTINSAIVLYYYLMVFPLNWLEIILIIVVQFLSMALFSLYFLYLYFLLQPFTENLKSKSATYNILVFIVYWFFYKLLKFANVMTMSFFLWILLATALFLVAGYVAVYCLAPKTFRLK